MPYVISSEVFEYREGFVEEGRFAECVTVEPPLPDEVHAEVADWIGLERGNGGNLPQGHSDHFESYGKSYFPYRLVNVPKGQTARADGYVLAERYPHTLHGLNTLLYAAEVIIRTHGFNAEVEEVHPSQGPR